MIPLIALCLTVPLEFGLNPLPEDSPYREEGFTKFTEVVAPNGKSIPIIAQKGVRDIAVARCRNLLTFYLTDVPGTRYGADKSSVANAMANNHAMLMMPEGAHREGHEPDVEAQPQFESETPVDGSRWYIRNDWEHRDAAFEEIFHLLHDTGIGTYMRGALPYYQKELKIEALKSIKDGRWGIPIDPHVQEWIKELAEEHSLAQEYIASVIDSYYGLWAAFDERPGGMWGIYIAKTREEIKEKDPKGYELIEAFLPPMMFGYVSLIDPNFSGTFSLQFNEELPYTHKSQYYVDATLTGKLNSNLLGNDSSNTFKGNSGNNILDGGGGNDTVIFRGKIDEYEIVGNVYKDTVTGRDGTDTLISIEEVTFAKD
ncbi:MAG: calcium-binding protein [Planctomycetes bacterium]|nr:calcium-binding protein [Planctomycetota bacterium]